MAGLDETIPNVFFSYIPFSNPITTKTYLFQNSALLQLKKPGQTLFLLFLPHISGITCTARVSVISFQTLSAGELSPQGSHGTMLVRLNGNQKTMERGPAQIISGLRNGKKFNFFFSKTFFPSYVGILKT